MEKIYFITEKQIREDTLINDNVESSYINRAIIEAQDINLQQVIGSSLYNSLREQIKTNTWKSDEYKSLIETYIQVYLENQVMANICIPLQFKFRNSGVVSNYDQHYQNNSLADVEIVRKHYESSATFYANRMIEYLIKNIKSFSELGDDQDWLHFHKSKTNSFPISFLK